MNKFLSLFPNLLEKFLFFFPCLNVIFLKVVKDAVLNSAVLKTTLSLNDLLEGITEIMKAIKLMDMVYFSKSTD